MDISNWINIGAIITIGGAATYYYGKLLNDLKPQQENKTKMYVDGFWFIVGYIVIPFALVYNDEIYYWFHCVFASVFYSVLYILLLFLIVVFAGVMTAGEYNRRVNISLEIDFTNPVSQSNIQGRETLRMVKWMIMWWGVVFLYLIPISTLILSNPVNVPFLITYIALAILYTSFVAILRGAYSTYYFPIKVVLDNGKEINGLLWEFKDPIVVWEIKELENGQQLRRKYNIPRSSVKYTVNEVVLHTGNNIHLSDFTTHREKTNNKEVLENA